MSRRLVDSFTVEIGDSYEARVGVYHDNRYTVYTELRKVRRLFGHPLSRTTVDKNESLVIESNGEAVGEKVTLHVAWAHKRVDERTTAEEIDAKEEMRSFIREKAEA